MKSFDCFVVISLDSGLTTSTSLPSAIDFDLNKITANVQGDLKLNFSHQDLTDANVPNVVRYAFEHNEVRIKMFIFKRMS